MAAAMLVRLTSPQSRRLRSLRLMFIAEFCGRLLLHTASCGVSTFLSFHQISANSVSYHAEGGREGEGKEETRPLLWHILLFGIHTFAKHTSTRRLDRIMTWVFNHFLIMEWESTLGGAEMSLKYLWRHY